MLYNIKDFTKELNIYNTVEFKKLDNYDNYFIYEDGRVFSLNRNRFLKFIDKEGYKWVGLMNNDKKRKIIFVHRLVYEAFKGQIPEGLQIDHINGIRDDNRLINLRLLTPKENSNNKHYFEQYKEIDKLRNLKYKERRNQYSKQYRENHKEEIKKYTKMYNQAHKEEIREKEKQYRKEHKDEIKERKKKYREEHREEINRKRREQYRLNKMNKIN